MNRVYGVVRGVVVDTLDAQRQGRVRVRFPTLFLEAGDRWAQTCRPLGVATAPVVRIGAEVWVMFENGDPDRPVVLGTAT